MENMQYPVECIVKFISREHRDGIPDETVEHIPFRQVTLNDNVRYTFGQVRRNLPLFAPARSNLATHNPLVAQWQARISLGNHPTSIHIANVDADDDSTTLVDGKPLRFGRRREVFSGAVITLGLLPVCRGKVVTYPPKFQLLVEPVIVTPWGLRPYYMYFSEEAAAVAAADAAAEAMEPAETKGDEAKAEAEAAGERTGGVADGENAGTEGERAWYPGLPLPTEGDLLGATVDDGVSGLALIAE